MQQRAGARTLGCDGREVLLYGQQELMLVIKRLLLLEADFSTCLVLRSQHPRLGCCIFKWGKDRYRLVPETSPVPPRK